jgi:hypothetical protein
VKKRGLTVALLSLAAAAGAWYWTSWRKSSALSALRLRVAELRGRVEKERTASAEAVEKYRPQDTGRVDDLGRPVADLLRQLPGVAGVEVVPASGKPARRLIHLRDFHYVPRDLFALELRGQGTITEEEMDLRYQEHLLEVELVQLEHLALLRCLARRHGLRRVFVEGITPEGVNNFREMVAALKKVDTDLNEQLQEVQRLLQGAKDGSERHAKAKAIEGEVLALLDRFRLDVLPLGTAGRLLMSGDVEEVLPLDDAKLLDEAKPIDPAGRFHLDPAKLSARHDGQVKAVLKAGAFALVPQTYPARQWMGSWDAAADRVGCGKSRSSQHPAQPVLTLEWGVVYHSHGSRDQLRQQVNLPLS